MRDTQVEFPTPFHISEKIDFWAAIFICLHFVSWWNKNAQQTNNLKDIAKPIFLILKKSVQQQLRKEWANELRVSQRWPVMALKWVKLTDEHRLFWSYTSSPFQFSIVSEHFCVFLRRGNYFDLDSKNRIFSYSSLAIWPNLELLSWSKMNLQKGDLDFFLNYWLIASMKKVRRLGVELW